MNLPPFSPDFDQLYQHSSDPWQVQKRWYEQRKQALLLASLPRRRYRHAFEPACGTGALTVALADRCDTVLASDGSVDAVRISSEKVTHLPHVHICRQSLPADWPCASFDLIVLSEWAYYLSDTDLLEVVRRCQASLSHDGTLIACHWRADFVQRRQSTDRIHALLNATAPWTRQAHHEEKDFLLEVWSATTPSVAQQEGLA